MTNHKQFQIKKKNLKNIFGCYNTKDSLTGNSGFSKKKKKTEQSGSFRAPAKP